MAFEEVTKTPTAIEINNLKRKYTNVCKKFESKKERFLDHIGWEDFEVLSSYDFIELKELYIEKKQLYWQLHALEHPDDKASKVAYDFLNSMSSLESVDWLRQHNLTTHQLIAEIANNPKYLEEVEA